MPAGEARAFPDLRAVPVHPAPSWPIYLAWASHAHLGSASAKLADLITASVPQS